MGVFEDDTIRVVGGTATSQNNLSITLYPIDLFLTSIIVSYFHVQSIVYIITLVFINELPAFLLVNENANIKFYEIV